ncbi:MAG: ubiquinol-cytochrome c reductase iron-sulfur subunit [Jatrophihabitans sp.]|uniref:QcrA and Rieske domain-containing protein n=1 Tax=Jatrophihabitans sp. TaxID=1932789 RepID=UPI0039164344
MSRRTALLAGAGAGAAALAACSGSNKPSHSGPTSAKAGNEGDLGPLSAVPVGQAKAVTLPGGKPGILARPTATTAACFSAICTHLGCTVQADGSKLNCPCHGSQYDALTGKVLRGPAPDPLPSIAVTVTDGNVVVKA